MQHLCELALQTIKKDHNLRAAPLESQPELSAFYPAADEAQFVAPNQTLQAALMQYAYKEAAQLDVKDNWYQRNIIEHLEIFIEMGSPEKANNEQIVQRRKEILTALQSNKAPDYTFLSHPADVKIVYLLSVSGKHGLAFHRTILSKSEMTAANLKFFPAGEAQPALNKQEKKQTLSEKTNKQTVSIKDINEAMKSYKDSCKIYAFFNARQGGTKFLTEKNISYLNYLAERYGKSSADTKAQKKLRAVYNALINKDRKALNEAVFMKTGWFESKAKKKGEFALAK
ncbi:MAG: hypothetical protein NTZ67_05895 [Gammaproteobacteria bacterium]|nr:hypothetical protein [Gammaproteobacteria bacterium]